MEKNENVEYFANMGIRLVGSVVVTAATGNKFDIAQLSTSAITTTIENKRG